MNILIFTAFRGMVQTMSPRFILKPFPMAQCACAVGCEVTCSQSDAKK